MIVKTKKATIFLQLLFRCLNIILNITVGIYILNLLGPEEQGKIAFALNTVGILGVLSTLGVGSYIAKLTAEENGINKLANVYKNVILLRLIGSILFLLLSLMIYFSLDKLDQIIVLIFMVLSRVTFSMNIFHDVFEGEGKLGDYAIINIISLFLVWPTRAYIAYEDLGIEYLSATYFIEQLFIIVCSTIYFRTFFYKKLSKLKLSHTYKLFRLTLPLALSSVVMSIFMQLDIFLIGIFLTNSDVGLYSAASKVVTPFFFIGTLLGSVFLPSLVKKYSNNLDSFYKLINDLSRMILLFSLFLIIGVEYYGQTIFESLFSVEYYPAFDVSKILIHSVPFVYLGAIFSKVMVIKHEYNAEFKRMLIALLVNIILGIILIPLLGLKGAAISTVISYFVGNYLFLYMNKSFYDLRKAINFSLVMKSWPL